jgi:antitoxin component of RelBE/YafQ-DinJ toxin-antitoxin module
MAKVDFIRARVEPATKQKAEAIFKKLGLSISETVNRIFLFWVGTKIILFISH